MKEWYLRQTARDRVIVLIVGALTVLGLLWAFVWYPLATGLDDNRTLIQSKQQTLSKMQVAAGQIKAMGPGAGATLKSMDGRTPLSVVDEVIRQGQIGKSDRSEPRGATGARVQFSEVEFDKLILVLGELELYGLGVDTINITRSPKVEGMVSARISLEKN